MNPSGSLAITGDTLRFTLPEREVWALPLSELAIVGECSTAWGPLADGFFLVFATRDGATMTAPYYAEGGSVVVEGLARHFGEPLRLQLIDSSSWDTRVMHPPLLAGQPMLELVDSPVHGWRARFASGLGSRNREAILAEPARRYLGFEDSGLRRPVS